MNSYECQVRTHGSRELELAVQYPLRSDRAVLKYSLDLFLFIPYQLGIVEETYGVSRFLNDMRAYIRHTVPAMSLRQQVDSNNSLSPLTRIRSLLPQAGSARELDDRLMYELQNLVNIYHRELRERRRRLKAGLGSAADAPAFTAAVEELAGESDGFLRAFRDCAGEFERSPARHLLQAFRWADEAVSLSTEKFWHKLYDAVRVQADAPASVVEFIRLRLPMEQQYRLARGYPTAVTPDDPVANESFVYREGMLKKWAESCMYMSRKPAHITRRVGQVLMGVAAGAAMAFAVVATFYASKWFPSYSVPWAILIVVGYIAKDRIKDMLRSVFIRYLPRIVADRVEELHDKVGDETVGSTRSRGRYVGSAQLPDSVRRLRLESANEFTGIIPAETILHFQTGVRIKSGRILQGHQRLASLTELIRLQLESFLGAMDDPVRQLSCMVNDTRVRVPARRVYHFHVLLRLTEQNRPAESNLFSYRLVLTRDGLVRIEELSAPPAAAARGMRGFLKGLDSRFERDEEDRV